MLAGDLTRTGGLAAALPWHHATSLHSALTLIALFVGVPMLAALIAALLTVAARAVLRHRRSANAQLTEATILEAQLRAKMSELCPHGWRAQVTLFGPTDELPADAPSGDRARVALDWAELDDDGGHVAIVRRVWAPTVVEALDAMISDRRTDETLEQIERAALWPDRGAPWPD